MWLYDLGPSKVQETSKMRKLIASVLLGTVIALGGCGLEKGVRPDVKIENTTTQQKLQIAIQNADAAIAAAEKTLIDSVKSNVIEYQEGYSYHLKLVDAAQKLDKAVAFYNLGDWTSAEIQLTVTKGLLKSVQDYLLTIKTGT
jgi:outer membrane lipopolysaccharide assembly protein LptE/RlpB